MNRPYRVLLWLSLTALAVALSLQNIRSFDYWWALRTGQLILDTASVPKLDPFSFTALGARWIDIHWIHQLGLYTTYYLGGHAGVVLAKMFFVVAMMLIMATVGYRRDRPIVSVVALALMLVVACDRFMARPELPSFLLLAGVLALLDRFSRTGDRWVYAIIGIHLLWANVHGLFAVGIVICGIYSAAELFRPWIGAEKQIRFDRLVPLTTVTALSIAVSFLNPNFADGVLYPISGLIGTSLSYLFHTQKRKNMWGIENALYCSAYAQKSYEAVGIDFTKSAHATNTSPEHIWRTPAPHEIYIRENERIEIEKLERGST